MRSPGRRRLAHGLAWLRVRGQVRALILGYHRVGGAGADPFHLSLSLEVFERHLLALRKHARPVPLSELVMAIRGNEMPDRMVAVTFDDAYAATLGLVEPMLSANGVPATVFAPAGLLGTEPWWDRVARMICADAHLPAELAVPLGGDGRFHRPLSEDERAGTPGSRERAQLASEVYGVLRSLPADDRRAALDALEGSMGGPDKSRRELVVSASELAALRDSDVFEFGSHSGTHPVLTELPAEVQRREIEESRGTLEALLGRRVDLFSYPNGARNGETDEIVREAGYLGACASQPGAATADGDPFALPRFWPVEDPDHVARLTRRWL